MLSQLRTAVVLLPHQHHHPPPPNHFIAQFTQYPRPTSIPIQTIQFPLAHPLSGHQQPILPAPLPSSTASTPSPTRPTSCLHQTTTTTTTITNISPVSNGKSNGIGTAQQQQQDDNNSRRSVDTPLNPVDMAPGALWTETEKIQLLLEILKDCDAQPNWRNIKIPSGRTSLQAQHVFASLTVSPSSSPIAGPASPGHRQSHTSHPVGAQTPGTASRKRPHPDSASFPQTPGSQTQSIKRKRGRPSKQDIALREQAGQGGSASAAWQHQTYTPDTGRGGVPLTAEGAPVPGSVTVPEGPGTTAGATTSHTVKKKRGRPSKAEVEARRAHEEETVRMQILRAQKVHGADLPPDVIEIMHPTAEEPEDEKTEAASPGKTSSEGGGDDTRDGEGDIEVGPEPE